MSIENGSSGATNGSKTLAINETAELLQKPKSPKRQKNKTVPPPQSRYESVYDISPSEVLDKELLRILIEVRNGNFDVRMPIDQVGISGKICDTLNEIIFMNQKMTEEFTRASNTIGKQGKLTHRIEVPFAKGSWSTGVDSLNTLITFTISIPVREHHALQEVC